MQSTGPPATGEGAGAGVDSGTDQPLSREDIFEVLSNRRRRYVLHYLKQLEGGTTTLPELATQVAAWETGESVPAVSYDDRKSVQTSLYQLHLPKLDEKGLVEYDRRAGEIERTDATAAVEMYLEAVPEREVSWPWFFLGLSGLVLLFAIAVAFDAAGFGWFPDAVGFVVGAGVFLAASTWYAYHHRFKMRLGTEGPPPETRR